MTWVDGVIAAAILLMGYRGWSSGGAAQFVRLLTLLVCAVIARFVTPEMALFYQGLTHTVAVDAVVMCYALSFGILYGISRYAVHHFSDQLADDQLHPNRLGAQFTGSVIGAARAAFYAALVLMSCLTYVSYVPEQVFDEVEADQVESSALKDSYAASLVAPRNFLLRESEKLEYRIQEIEAKPSTTPEVLK